MKIKDILLNNWKAKLMSLLMAILLWITLKEIIEPGTIDMIKTGTTVTSPIRSDILK
jgi:YbbR domain-containing protein